MDAKKRARDTSRIVFSDEQTVAQLVRGSQVLHVVPLSYMGDAVDLISRKGKKESLQVR